MNKMCGICEILSQNPKLLLAFEEVIEKIKKDGEQTSNNENKIEEKTEKEKVEKENELINIDFENIIINKENIAPNYNKKLITSPLPYSSRENNISASTLNLGPRRENVVLNQIGGKNMSFMRNIMKGNKICIICLIFPFLTIITKLES